MISFWEREYDKHVTRCRPCRMALNTLLRDRAEIKVPEDLCHEGQMLYDEKALEAWRAARAAAQTMDQAILADVK